MLLKLAALGALGYAGYKYYEKNKDSFRFDSGSSSSTRVGSEDTAPAIALAGGPLSNNARVQHSPDITAS